MTARKPCISLGRNTAELILMKCTLFLRNKTFDMGKKAASLSSNFNYQINACEISADSFCKC